MNGPDFVPRNAAEAWQETLNDNFQPPWAAVAMNWTERTPAVRARSRGSPKAPPTWCEETPPADQKPPRTARSKWPLAFESTPTSPLAKPTYHAKAEPLTKLVADPSRLDCVLESLNAIQGLDGQEHVALQPMPVHGKSARIVCSSASVGSRQPFDPANPGVFRPVVRKVVNAVPSSAYGKPVLHE